MMGRPGTARLIQLALCLSRLARKEVQCVFGGPNAESPGFRQGLHGPFPHAAKRKGGVQIKVTPEFYMTTPESVAPISNELAEELIIGRILVDPEAIGKVMPTLLPEAITNEHLREIYRTALMLQCQNAAPTVEAVSAWLMALDLLSDEMKSVLQDCHNIARAKSGEILLPAVRLVMTKYLRRIAASMSEKLSEMAEDFSLPVEELVSRAAWSAELLQKLLPDCIEQSTEA